jgi:glycosyltransferase involved in cell wall biosynthesis/2-polyprenyl-3-methyl-5-hydroxy-6-metoxy-1,4-benzoquinol methylase
MSMQVLCPVCGCAESSVLGTTGIIPIALQEGVSRRRKVKKCRCGLLTVEPVPTEIELQDYYKEYALHEVSAQNEDGWRARTAFEVVAEVASKVHGGRVLDAGCGRGELLAMLPGGLQKYGIDISAEACRFAEGRGIKMVCSSICDATFDCDFDLIVALDVLEHCAEPVAVIGHLSGFLSPGGYLVIQTGNADSLAARTLREDWAYTAVFGHINVLGVTSLRLMLEKSGLQVVSQLRCFHTREMFLTQVWRNFRAYAFHSYRQLYRAVSPLSSKMSMLERFYNHHPPASLSRDHMTVTARKRGRMGLHSLAPNVNRRIEGGLRLNGTVRKSHPGQPLVTIVTVARNMEETIECTIRSVLAQTYKNTEYIIIDGGSSDRTTDIIRRYEHSIDYWVSEPDGGISDAFNKGVSLAQGEFVTFVNADDWLSPDQVEEGAKALTGSTAGYAFGDLAFHDGSDAGQYTIKGDAAYGEKIHKRLPDMNHPTVIARRDLFAAIGGFDERYSIAMDYEWLYRAHLAGYKGLYVPAIVGHMRLDGCSDARYVKAYRQVRDISVEYGYPAWKAQVLFVYRAVRTWMRRVIERVFGEALARKIRQEVHHGFDNSKGRIGK